jgi:hypothetical protein
LEEEYNNDNNSNNNSNNKNNYVNENTCGSKSNRDGCLAFDVQEIRGFSAMNYKPGPGYFKKYGHLEYEYIPLRRFVFKKKVEEIDFVSESKSKSESQSKSKSKSKDKDEPVKKKIKLIVQIEVGWVEKVCIEVFPKKHD